MVRSSAWDKIRPHPHPPAPKMGQQTPPTPSLNTGKHLPTPYLGKTSPLPNPKKWKTWKNVKKYEKVEKTQKIIKKRRSQNHARNDRGEILSIFHTGRPRIRQVSENPIFWSNLGQRGMLLMGIQY